LGLNGIYLGGGGRIPMVMVWSCIAPIQWWRIFIFILWAFVLSLQHYHPFNLEALTLSLCGEWEWRIWIWIWFLVFDFILLVILYLLLFAPQMEKRRPSIFLISTPHDKIELHFVLSIADECPRILFKHSNKLFIQI
jgi:hypothetical protein